MRTIFNKTNLKERRAELRNNMTSSEAMFWNLIKNKKLGVKFRRQHGIGSYIVDFYSREIDLVIEIDGGIHDEIIQQSNDEIRDDYLNSLGLKVIRFSNEEIFHDEERVIQELTEIIEKQRKI